MKLYKISCLLLSLCLFLSSCAFSQQDEQEKEERIVNNSILTYVESNEELPLYTKGVLDISGNDYVEKRSCIYSEEAPEESIPTKTDVSKGEYDDVFARIKFPKNTDCLIVSDGKQLCYKNGIIFGDMPWYGYYAEDEEVVCVYTDANSEYQYVAGDCDDARLEICYPENTEYEDASFSASGACVACIELDRVLFYYNEFDSFEVKEIHGREKGHIDITPEPIYNTNGYY